MELSEIRSFTTVAQLGSFSRASLRLGVPQPTLSRQIARLEGDLGAPLFYRNGRGATLTDAGQSFLDGIGPILSQLDRLRSDMRAQSGEAGGCVRLGVPPSIGRSIAGSVVADFLRECPEARLQLVEGFSGTLAEWLETGAVDAAILYDTKRATHLTASPLLDEELFLICGPGDQRPVALREIDTSRLILSSRGQGLRRAVENGFENAGVPLGWAMEIDSIPTTKELVATGDFTTILPYGATHREIEDGRLIARPIKADMRALLVLGTAHSRPVTRATRHLLGIIERKVVEFVDQGILHGRCGTARVVPFDRRASG